VVRALPTRNASVRGRQPNPAGPDHLRGRHLQDREPDAAAVIDRTGVTYELARDRDGSLFTQLGAIAMPTTLLIDSDGNVIEMISGEISADALDDKIKDVVGS